MITYTLLGFQWDGGSTVEDRVLLEHNTLDRAEEPIESDSMHDLETEGVSAVEKHSALRESVKRR